MDIHKNARLTPHSRERLARMIGSGQTPQAAGEAGFDSPDEVMDAILALDDLHRAGKITDEAYQARRADLKGILKDIA